MSTGEHNRINKKKGQLYGMFEPDDCEQLLPQSENDLKLNKDSHKSLVSDIFRLKRILQFYPKSAIDSENSRDDTELFAIARCKGYMLMKRDPSISVQGANSKRYFFELVGTQLTYRLDESDINYKGHIRVSFSTVEAPVQFSEKNEFEDLFLAYLDSQEGQHCFKIFSPNQIYTLQAETHEQRTEFVTAIRDELQKVLARDMWRAKEASAKELAPLCQEQFVFSMSRHKEVMESLETCGLVENVSVLKSKHKDKSGVMSLQQTDIDRGIDVGDQKEVDWQNYFFVLQEGCLYYFTHSKATIPKGFVALKYAHIQLDDVAIAEKEFVFRITTPLRTLCLRTKHDVALAEWTSTLDNEINNSCRMVSGSSSDLSTTASDVENVLKKIKTLQSNVGTFSGVINHPTGSNLFKTFLDQNDAAPLLLFWITLRQYKCRFKFESGEHCSSVEMGDDKKLSDKKLAVCQFPQTDFKLEDNSEFSEFNFAQTQSPSKSVELGLGESNDSTSRNSLEAARDIFKRFLTKTSDVSLLKLIELDRFTLNDIEREIEFPSRNIFQVVQDCVGKRLRNYFSNFVQSDEYEKFVNDASLNQTNDSFEDRVVDPFPQNSELSFVATITKQKKQVVKIFKLPSSRRTMTIGRDYANDIIIDDKRLSRSHARIEYNDTECVYFDLGATRGTEMSKKAFIHGNLQHGDKLHVGHTILEFQVREKKKTLISKIFN